MMAKGKKTLKEGSFKTIPELKHTYNNWAANYDQDLLDTMGYQVPQFAVNTFTSYIPPESKILDAGSGTGIVGMLLKKAGYTTIEALDISEGMLEIAKAKNIYQAYHLEILGEHLKSSDDTYDAIIAVGTFGSTHAPPHAFDELIRITKPNGYILFTMRENETPQQGVFRKKITALEQAQKWVLLEESDTFQGFTESKSHLLYKNFVYQVL